MTIVIADNSPRKTYTATAGQTDFPTDFAFFAKADVNVYVNGTPKTLDSDFSIPTTGPSAWTSGNDGTVVFTTGLSAGDSVVLTRDVELERTTDFPSSGPFQVATLNTELDKIVAMIADLADLADRGLRLSDTDTSASLVLADKDSRKGTVLAFNSTTGAVEIGPTIADTQSIADIKADIAALADIEDGTVATDAISNLAAITSDVTTAASNITAIQNASANATTASTKATEAATSATAAAASATAAAASETAAETAETNAETAETNAATSATNAATSATSAASSATTATTKASEASTSATNAATSATSASTAQTAAETAQTAAETAQTAAETAETNAETAQTAAETAKTAAETAETNAATSETNAATSATTATTKASEAATSATNAASSATSAASAQTAAESARDSALAAYDNFDDRYLGVKTSNPTVDNDGDALVAGALYFNSTSQKFLVYNGSSWVDAYADGASLVSKSGDTMTGDLTVPNLITSGNVDGRDVSTDGTKLDGIAAGADVTPSWVPASDPGYITSADGGNATTLDGIDSGSFLRSDANDTMTGTLTMSNKSIDFTGVNQAIRMFNGSGGAAHQRADCRDDGTNSRIHWYGVNDSSGTSNFRHAWYTGGQYVNVTAHTSVAGTHGVEFDGNLSITKNAPKLELDSSSSGSNTNEQSATISLGESGAEGSASLHLAYTGDGYSYIGMGNLGSDNIPDYRAMRFYYTNDNVHFYDSLTCAGNITAYSSDRRLKENIQTIDNAMNMVSRLRGVTFDWKDGLEELGFSPDMKTETGLIAQELQEVIPDAVVPAPFDHDESGSISGENYLTVKPEKVIPVLIEAIKELKAEIEELKNGSTN